MWRTGEIILTGKLTYSEKTCPNSTLIIINLKGTNIGSKPALHGDRKVMHRLSHIHVLVLLMEAHCVICEVPTECIYWRTIYSSQMVGCTAPGPPTSAHSPSPGPFLSPAPGTFTASRALSCSVRLAFPLRPSLRTPLLGTVSSINFTMI